MFDAVRNGPSEYTAAEREAWVPSRRGGAEWRQRLDRQFVACARDEAGVVGFMSLDVGGYVDFAYIRPRARRTGLFRRLYDMIEEQGLRRGDRRLWVHASLMAQPAFAAVGFALVRHETVRIGAETLRRAEMEKFTPGIGVARANC